MTPAWLLDLLAVSMLTVAALTATRILARLLLPELPWRPGQGANSVDLANVLMGISMAGMFTPSLTTLPAVAWEVVFGLLTAWFAWRAWADTRSVRALTADRCTLHVVHSAAMLYAFLALSAASSGGGGMAGMGGGGPAAMPTLGHPTIAGAFVVLLVGYCVWDLNQLSGGRFRLAAAGGPAAAAVPAQAEAPGTESPRREPAVRTFVLAPQTRVGSDVILGIGMAFMLVIMI
ncbi:MAG TPA: DUF5134 domain-containing protein [Trebonia sp.]|nr:DUF5134 domain-containing protein [Trebonia sp.]